MKKRLLLVLSLVLGLIASIQPAGAAFPGRNGRVVFVGGYFDQGLTTGCTDQSWHIYSVHTDGKGLRRLDEGVPYAGQPRWSPGGGWVAFNGGDGSSRGNEIYIVRSDGTGLTRLRTTGSSTRSQPGRPGADDWSSSAGTPGS